MNKIKITSLTLCGFKSYRNYTTLDIGDQFIRYLIVTKSSIIGKNGSGKSVIFDAIMWVLGINKSDLRISIFFFIYR